MTIDTAGIDEFVGQVGRSFAEGPTLLIILVYKHWQVQTDQNDIRRAQRICVKALPPDDSEYLCKVAESLRQQDQKEEHVEEDEGDKVLVVPIAQAVVDERTVVVKPFDTLVANRAMERSLRLDDFTVGTHVV